ncbi:hypothetical protein UFOVP176_5 [uncultured Caudovirales phage]|uniref:Uncharacterized protein n=1 Tax=uncultured Caudovirales phage TaxID=2100421 RepID=A0A6J7WBC2_9CAUD|nr:hypothetical protein UFOVP176_5 [uncultured Caudovirales phage]
MPVYQYDGQHFDLPEGLSNEQAISKIEAHLGKTQPAQITQSSPTDVNTGEIKSGFAMGLKDPISGGAQLLPRGLEAVTSLGGLAPNPVSQFFGSEAKRVDQMVKAEQDKYAQQRAASGQEGLDLGRIAGNVINPANAVAGVRAAPVLAGAIQGALTPTTETGDFAAEKAGQVATGAIGGQLGSVAAKAVGTALNPLVTKAEQTMRDLGVTPTVGQALGGAYRKAEDFAQNLPLIGEAVRSAREKVLFDFNKGVINKALNKIDDKLPANVIGRDAVSYAAEQVGKKYDSVLEKMSFNLDMKTTKGILQALNDAGLPSEAQRTEAINVLNSTVMNKFAGKTLTGAEYKAIESDLRKEAQGYLNSTTNAERKIGEALKNVLGSFKEQLAAQNPKMTPQLRRVDSAYGDLSVMERAAANGGAVNGVFTPKNYQTAVRQADVSRQKRSFARGNARGQDVAEAAMETLGKDSASTLEGRLALSNLGGSAVALAASPVAALMYTDAGKKAVDTLMRSRPDLARQLGAQLQQAAPTVGGLFGAPIATDINR